MLKTIERRPIVEQNKNYISHHINFIHNQVILSSYLRTQGIPLGKATFASILKNKKISRTFASVLFESQILNMTSKTERNLELKFIDMLNLVLFGPPGAGKGTQSQKLIEKYQLVHLSTGDILRGEIAQGTPLGLEAKKLMDDGKLVPDEVVIGMISNKLDSNPNAKGFIFDGFPRTVAQAEALDQLLQSKHEQISGMIALEVAEDELEKRLLLRGKESGRADDANPEIIRKRIAEYNAKTTPVAQYYNQQGKLQTINGIGSIDDIFNHICQVIATYSAS